MNVPRATYRLQFHHGFTLQHALELLPYLDALGVSHIYASPLLKARAGSLHGYDVCDPSCINPEIGTEAELETFVAALRERGMGLVLDIVPNHMAASPENPWWWDLLKHGGKSRFADCFDVDWNVPDPARRGKIFLPVLGDEFERVLERGEFTVVRENAEVVLRYFDHRFPVNPESVLLPGKSPDAALAEFNSSHAALAKLLDQQYYRPGFWLHGDSLVNYRRFFAVSELAGVRVELPPVFAGAHHRILDWHQRGLVDGLRMDHPDGLRDPQHYLARLAHAAPGAWLLVEKILEPGETLPADWPVQGTVGYEFLNRAGGLFIAGAGEKPLTEFYREFTGEPLDYANIVREKKRAALRSLLVAEVNRLLRRFAAIIAARAPEIVADTETLRDALIEFIVCFGVYRTYARAEDDFLSGTDRARISEAFNAAANNVLPGVPLEVQTKNSPAVLTFLKDLLQLKFPGKAENEFVMRFQQLTGPAMAKGVEDAAYYCFNRFIALNEVGGDPEHFGVRVEEFHQACAQDQRHLPGTMLSTSTHDTKRSEDVRARLAVLSEIPAPWSDAVRRWSALNEKHRRNNSPDRNAEYFFYQTLVGAWPLPAGRALAYMEKVVRESGQHTGWNQRNELYEAGLKHFISAVLQDREFIADLEHFLAPLVLPGRVNSLAQTLLKLTAPGVPDVYQGTDMWDYSLVDPDNRRPVDFAVRRAALVEMDRQIAAGEIQKHCDDLLHHSADGHIKLFVIRQALQFRRMQPELFRTGGYEPLFATGKSTAHVCAFARRLEGAAALTIVPRLTFHLAMERGGLPVGMEVWGDMRLILPRTEPGTSFRNVFTREIICADGHEGKSTLRLAGILAKFPVALLERLDSANQSLT